MYKIKEIAEALDIEPWRIRGAIERGTIKFRDDFSPPYFVFTRALGKIEAGTAIFLGEKIEVIRGFPKIKRAFFLSNAVKNHFEDKVAVEEKMNGYNVRVFSIEKKLIAITRGGYVCPYTTNKIRKNKKISRFLKENNKVLCGEVVGLENPYAIHCYEEAPKFGYFVFDIREKGSNMPMSIKEKNSLLEEYVIEKVRLFGIYSKEEVVEKTFEILKKLEEENREGVVLKDPEMKLEPLKYTPSKTNTSDLRHAFRFPFDFGRDFFFSRIIREGFQAVELEEDEEELKERAKRIGESILFPMVETIRRVRNKEVVTDDYQIRVESMEEIKTLMRYLQRQGVTCILGDVMQENKTFVATLKRIRPNSNDKIKSILEKGVTSE